MNYISTILFNVLIIFSAYSQQNADSLVELLHSFKGADAEKIVIMNDLSEVLYLTDPKKSRIYGERALELGQKINNVNELARSYQIIGLSYFQESDYRDALEYYEAAEKLWKKLNKKENIGRIYLLIGRANEKLGNFKGAFGNYQKSLEIYQVSGDSKSIAETNIGIGVCQFYLGNYDDAVENYMNSLTIYKQMALSNDSIIIKSGKNGMAGVYNNLALVYSSQGNYEKALEYHLNGLKINEDIGQKDAIANSYTNLGVIYFYLEDFPNAIQFYEKAHKLWEETNNKNGIAGTLNNIGLVYEKQEQYDKALEYYFKTLSVMESIGAKGRMGMSYNNIGNIYNKQNNFSKALEYYNKSLEIRQEIGDKNGLALTYNYIGLLYLNQGYFEQAKNNLLKGLDIANEIGAKSTKQDIFLTLSQLEEKRGNVSSAFNFYKKYTSLKDSILNSEKNQLIAEMQTKYDTERKEKEIVLLTREKEIQNLELNRQRTIMFFLIGFAALMLLLAFVIFRSYRQKQKANRLLAEQKNEIQKYAENLKKANDVITEKNIQITSSINYAKRIQSAILPPEDILKNILPQHFLIFMPRDIVSGDFYWIKLVHVSAGVTCNHEVDSGTVPPSHPVNTTRLIFAAADCTGHGVPGAFMSMLGVALLNEIINKEPGLPANQILNQLRDNIINSLHQTGIEDPIDEFINKNLLSSKDLRPYVSTADNSKPSSIRSKPGTIDIIKDGMDIALCAIDLTPTPLQAKRGEETRSLPSSLGEGLGVRLQFAGANNPLYLITPDPQGHINKGNCHSISSGTEQSDPSTPLRTSLAGQALLKEVKGDKMPVGFHYKSENFSFTNHEIELNQGDTLYIFSDGFADQFGGPHGKKFKYVPFKQLLLSIQEKSLDEQSLMLTQVIKEWMSHINPITGEHFEQVDDILIIGLRI
ncbi:MAG: tetratricopeptide repeat protein [Bacteroidia bacterium]|nr:tetratricopeptide repeat protein [Bacteroidia bacterium]